MVGQLRFVSAHTKLHESALAVVEERGARLRGMAFEAGIVSPETVVDHVADGVLRHAAGMILSQVLFALLKLCVAVEISVAVIPHVGNESTRGVGHADGAVPAVAADLHVVARHVGAVLHRHGLTDALEVDSPKPGVDQPDKVERFVSSVVLPGLMMMEIFC